jgi:hypothetical protein
MGNESRVITNLSKFRKNSENMRHFLIITLLILNEIKSISINFIINRLFILVEINVMNLSVNWL